MKTENMIIIFCIFFKCDILCFAVLRMQRFPALHFIRSTKIGFNTLLLLMDEDPLSYNTVDVRSLLIY